MAASLADAQDVERWGIYELSLTQAGTYDNPFAEVRLKCRFESGGQAVTADGFYDGGTAWKVRFMPSDEGRWTYRTQSNDPGLDGKAGEFVCAAPSKGNHGPVRVAKTHHFSYADGVPYFEVGTTCYAWAHQGDELEEQTLKTLSEAPFNKIRMCVFPKSYTYNKNEPQYYPFEGKPLRDWDFTRFNPEFFRHFEKRVGDLLQLGIEADIILFHPYDRWGFATMGAESDDRYLRYVVARLSAYRNVWWSLANEYDLMKDKSTADWDRFFQIIRDGDPYHHLRSIHNCRQWYDHTKPWVTHASIQSAYFGNAVELREKYAKPLVYDECRYEGNVPQGWGNLTAQQMVDHFWQGTIAGCYVGHGETLKDPHDILWWSKGGVLHGDSPPRIAFLRDIMEKLPFQDMAPSMDLSPGNCILHKPGECYLVYFTGDVPATLDLPGGVAYRVDSIDTWAMTVTPLADAEPGPFTFAPPRLPCLLRLVAYKPAESRRPKPAATVEPPDGVAPLKVSFAGTKGLKCRWDLGDGTQAEGERVTHTYERPGLYAVALTVTDDDGQSACAYLTVAADFPGVESLVRVGFREGETHPLTLHGDVKRGDDGSLDMGDSEPWKWVSVGDGPIEQLEGLRSFTILGWVNPASLQIGSGGNRIACNLQYNRSGLDIVHLADGRLRLAVNEWPDGARNDSSSDRMKTNEWTFFAVTYDGMSSHDNVHWYFGSEGKPAELDTTNTYARGPIGRGSGPLSIGNYNETLHGAGLDRQFRGRLRGIEIFGSIASSRGALSLAQIRERQ